jgi:branched-chain amino acid transport system permease protein
MLGQTLANGFLRSGLYALTSVGLALAVGVIGIINFAHGEFLMLGAYLAVFLFLGAGLDPFLVLPLAALGGALLGGLIYTGTIRRVLQAPELNQMLLTFGLSVIIQNLALILWTGDPRAINAPYRTLILSLGGVSISLGRALALLLALVLVAGLYLFLARTRLGKAMRAVAQSRQGAGLVGIEVERIYIVAFGLAAALAAMAGVMLALNLYAEPHVGLGFTLRAFAIIVLAGLGNIYGVVWASVFLGVCESFIGTYVPSGTGWADGVFFIIILVALSLRRQVPGHGHGGE